MTDTPPAAPSDPPDGTPGHGGERRFAAQPGQHESAGPQSPGTSAGHGRHEMPGPAGYPQFEGPGAAQYGNEPVEPPPQVATHTAQPGQPAYGAPGTGPGTMPPPGSMPPGAAPPPGWAPPPGTIPAGGDVPVASGQEQTYGYQAKSPTGLDVGAALSYGLDKFRANAVSWISVTAIGMVIYIAVWLIVRAAGPTSLFSVLVLFLAVLAGIWLLQAAMIRGALYETDGYKPAFGAYFRFVNAGNVLLTALLVFVVATLGSVFCIVPGMIIGFLCMFSLHYVVDHDQGPIEAIKSSFLLVVGNIWPLLLLALAVVVLVLFGLITCGIGLLVSGPIAVIAVTYAFRTLTDGTVAPK